MKKTRIYKYIKKISVSLVLIMLLFANSGFVYAIGEDQLSTVAAPIVGPQGDIGVTGEIGSNGVVGPTGQIGPIPENTPNNIVIDNANSGTIQNEGEQGIISGQNTSSQNSGSGGVASGEADISAGLVNSSGSQIPDSWNDGIINTQNVLGDIPIQGIPSIFNGSAANSNTGSSSENGASLDLMNNIIFSNQNSAIIGNSLPINIDTGNNAANFNTGNGSVDSGDANLALNLLNFVDTYLTGNVTFGILSIFGDYFGDLVLPEFASSNGTGGVVVVSDNSNTNTGNNSSNTAKTNIENMASIINNNQSDIKNALPIDLNTGGNEVNYNTGGGSANSGNINAESNTISIVGGFFRGDTWYMVVVNVLGGWFGNLLGNKSNVLVGGTEGGVSSSNNHATINANTSNEKTGENSQNDAQINLESSKTLENKNTTGIKNNVPITINTGNNQANGNTGKGSISSGNIGLITNFINFIQTNIMAKNINLLFVNIFGNWKGSVKKYEPKQVDALPGTGQQNQGTRESIEIDNSNMNSYLEKIKENIVKKGSSNRGDKDISIIIDNATPPDNSIKGGVEVKASKSSFSQNQAEKNANNRINILKGLILLSLLLAVAGLGYQKYMIKNKERG